MDIIATHCGQVVATLIDDALTQTAPAELRSLFYCEHGFNCETGEPIPPPPEPQPGTPDPEFLPDPPEGFDEGYGTLP